MRSKDPNKILLTVVVDIKTVVKMGDFLLVKLNRMTNQNVARKKIVWRNDVNISFESLMNKVMFSQDFLSFSYK